MKILSKSNSVIEAIVIYLMAVSFLGAGCAHQQTADSKIYRVATLSGTNYYRVRITSSAWNGKAQFKAGLYPAYAVDMFRGQESELPTDMIEAESEVRKMVVRAQTNALHDYLSADPDARQKATDKLVAVQEVVLGRGGTSIGNNYVTSPLEFNAIKGLVDHTAGKKFVIVLSSDPDEILNGISSFVEESKTAETFQEAITAQLSAGKQSDAERVRMHNRELLIQALAEDLGKSATKGVTNAGDLKAIISEIQSSAEGLK